MSLTAFQRFLEDVLREEILTMGLAYDEIVASIAEQRNGEAYTIRFHGETHDLEVIEPAELPSRAALAALLRRKLELAVRVHRSTQ